MEEPTYSFRSMPTSREKRRAAHRLENPGKIQLELIEVKTGIYLAEDDIIRIEDDYRRS